LINSIRIGMRLMRGFILLGSLRFDLDFAVCLLRDISLQSIWKKRKFSRCFFHLDQRERSI